MTSPTKSIPAAAIPATLSDTVRWGAFSAALLAIAMPPFQCSPAIWLAPFGWLVVIMRPRLETSRPYLKLWFLAWLFWAVYLWGIRSAFWALYFGWLALSMYLACYVPLFVAICRRLVHRYRMPLLLVAPTVWTLLEVVRGYMFTGFSGALFAHALARNPLLIQIADLGGAYLVTWVIWLVATAGFALVHGRSRAVRAGSALVGVAALALVVVYGSRTADPGLYEARDRVKSLRVALLQESIDTIFDSNLQLSVDMFYRYRSLAAIVTDDNPELDLMVWPESAFTANLPDQLLPSLERLQPPQRFVDQADEYRKFVSERQNRFEDKIRDVTEAANPRSNSATFLLVGTDTIDYQLQPPRVYNSALLLSPNGAIVDRYFKQHPVPFGEYIPLLRHFPALAEYSPIGAGISTGTEPGAFRVREFLISPSICFESTVPHVIRDQVVKLTNQGTPPDLLINVTNDGWFWGSGILDMQFHCAIFRAVECRRPYLIAANTGISGWIGPDGRVVEELVRRKPGVIVAAVPKHIGTTMYLKYGNGGIILALSVCLLVGRILASIRRSQAPG